MMTPELRQRILLALLAVLVPLSAWLYLRPWLLDFASAGGSTILRRAEGTAASRGTADREVVELQLATLDAPVRSYHPGRNIFQFAVKPPPPPPPPPPAPPVRPPPPALPPPPAVPQPPPVNFKLVGIFGPESGRIAVFRNGKDVINAREKEVVLKKFIVHKIGYQSVDIAFVDFPNARPKRLEIEG